MEQTIHDIFVNRILSEKGITKGYVVYEDTIEKDLKIIFTNIERAVFASIAESAVDGFYTFERFCQFLIHFTYNSGRDIPELKGWTIVVVDYNNDINAALEEYTEMRGNNWSKEDADRIMTIFSEIEKHHYVESAKMIIEKY